MSLLWRNKNGNEMPVAGLNGLSGELVYGASTVRTGTATGTLNANEQKNITVTFSEPMPDTEYEVTLDLQKAFTGGGTFDVKPPYNKTVNGFSLIVTNGFNSSITYTIGYQAFKLFTVEGLEDLENSVSDLQTSKQNKLTFDTIPTANSTNPVTSGGILTALNTKQNTLTVSQTTVAVPSGGIRLAKYGRIVQANFQIVGDSLAGNFTSGVWTQYGTAGVIPTEYRPLQETYVGTMISETPILFRVLTSGTIWYYYTGGQLGYEIEWSKTYISAS